MPASRMSLGLNPGCSASDPDANGLGNDEDGQSAWALLPTWQTQMKLLVRALGWPVLALVVTCGLSSSREIFVVLYFTFKDF